jgi:RNA polymerase sigma factor (sigma-70 family)
MGTAAVMRETGLAAGTDAWGAEERFRLLVAQHERVLLAFAMRRVPDTADALDVVADTFLVAWRRLDAVPVGDAARLWLYTACRHAIGNHYRGTGRRSRLADRLRQEGTDRSTPDPGVAVATAAVVRAAMQRLDPEDREVLHLTGWEGLSPAELAVVLQVPPPTARTRLHRARKRLRAALIELGETAEGTVEHSAAVRDPGSAS